MLIVLQVLDYCGRTSILFLTITPPHIYTITIAVYSRKLGLTPLIYETEPSEI